MLALAMSLVAPVSCSPPEPTEPPVTTPPVEEPGQLEQLDALQLLLDNLIAPASSSAQVSAYMHSEPLNSGDVVTSEDGSRYPITKPTWFAFIDDAPRAFFAHACRYVFMDAKTGSLEVVGESWPPDINGVSMWNQPPGGPHVVEVLSVHGIPLPAAAGTMVPAFACLWCHIGDEQDVAADLGDVHPACQSGGDRRHDVTAMKGRTDRGSEQALVGHLVNGSGIELEKRGKDAVVRADKGLPGRAEGEDTPDRPDTGIDDCQVS